MKKIWILLPVFLILTYAVITGCKKATPAEPSPAATCTVTPTITETSTITATFTSTATATMTITPDDAAKAYDFETGQDGWFTASGSNAVTSASLDASAANAHGGSQSLAVGFNIDGSNDRALVSKNFSSTPLNMSGKTALFWVNLPAGMLTSSVFKGVLFLVDYSNVSHSYATIDFTTEGQNQCTFTLPTDTAIEMIKEVQIGIQWESGAAVNDILYIDDISW
jgi:hypothetical protein